MAVAAHVITRPLQGLRRLPLAAKISVAFVGLIVLVGIFAPEFH